MQWHFYSLTVIRKAKDSHPSRLLDRHISNSSISQSVTARKPVDFKKKTNLRQSVSLLTHWSLFFYCHSPPPLTYLCTLSSSTHFNALPLLASTKPDFQMLIIPSFGPFELQTRIIITHHRPGFPFWQEHQTLIDSPCSKLDELISTSSHISSTSTTHVHVNIFTFCLTNERLKRVIESVGVDTRSMLVKDDITLVFTSVLPFLVGCVGLRSCLNKKPCTHSGWKVSVSMSLQFY